MMFILFLILFSDIVAAMVLGCYMWGLRNGGQTWLVRLFAMVFWALSIRELMGFIAILMLNADSLPKIEPDFVFWWIGRAVQTIALWWAVCRIFSFRKSFGKVYVKVEKTVIDQK